MVETGGIGKGIVRLGGFFACAGLGGAALVVAWTLLLAQRGENRQMLLFARQLTIGADDNQERLERITRFVHEHNQRVLSVSRGNLSTWVSPPPPLEPLLLAWPAAGRRLKSHFEPPYHSFLKPSAQQVYFRGSDCAGTARLVIRLLAALGIRARKLALHDESGVARHAVVEARVQGRWVVADPLHGRVYTLEDGRLATLEDLQREPWLAEQQLVRGENPVIADFRDARTMNWQKIPGWMPLFYKTLHRTFGARVDHIPRPAIAETPRALAAAALGAIGCFLLLPPGIACLRHLRRRRRPSSP